MMKVGLPRALLYYKYYPFWKKFLEGLGFEIVLSPFTNKEILYKGVSICMDESCFPVKVFCGHIAWLKDRVDYIFVYRIASVERKEFLCSKFWGLPDISRNLFPECSFLTLNVNCNNEFYFMSLFKFALRFEKNPFKILNVLHTAQKTQEKFNEVIQSRKVDFLTALEAIEKEKSFFNNTVSNSYDIKLAVLSHPYNLYDRFVSLDILKKLQELGVGVFTYEMIPEKELIKEGKKFKNIYWTYNKEMAAALSFFLKQGIDGAIFVVSFPCGPDSLVVEYLNKEFKEKIPILNLVVDEHQADVGFLTRLESFIDIVRKRKARNEM